MGPRFSGVRLWVVITHNGRDRSVKVSHEIMLSGDDMFAVGVDQCWLAAPLWNRFCCLISSIEHSCCNEWVSE